MGESEDLRALQRRVEGWRRNGAVGVSMAAENRSDLALNEGGAPGLTGKDLTTSPQAGARATERPRVAVGWLRLPPQPPSVSQPTHRASLERQNHAVLQSRQHRRAKS